MLIDIPIIPYMEHLGMKDIERIIADAREHNVYVTVTRTTNARRPACAGLKLAKDMLCALRQLPPTWGNIIGSSQAATFQLESGADEVAYVSVDKHGLRNVIGLAADTTTVGERLTIDGVDISCSTGCTNQPGLFIFGLRSA